MKALTLIQPWAWCITHAGKRVENRTWTVGALVGVERLAIHAGKSPEIVEAVSQLSAEGGDYGPTYSATYCSQCGRRERKNFSTMVCYGDTGIGDWRTGCRGHLRFVDDGAKPYATLWQLAPRHA